MASPRCVEEASSDTQVRAFVDRLRASGRLDGLFGKIAFLVQAQDVGSAMLRRVVSSDPLFGPVLIKKLESRLPAATKDQDAFDLLSPSDCRRWLSATAIGLFAAITSPGSQAWSQRFVRESLAMSIVAEGLAAGVKTSTAEGLCAFTCTHALGRMVMLGSYGAEYEAVLDSSDLPDVEAERAEFGVDHAAAASLLLNRFGFPILATEAHAGHHGPIQELKELSLVLAISENVANHMGFGFGRAGLDAEKVKPWLLRMGAKPEFVPNWKSTVESMEVGI